MKYKILASNGSIPSETFEISDGVRDRNGNPQIVGQSGRKLIIHPSRLLPINSGGAVVKSASGDFSVECPHCSAPQAADVGSNTTCVKCGQKFDLDWRKIKAKQIKAKTVELKMPKVRKRKPQIFKGVSISKEPVLVDFKLMVTTGEVWTKTGINFDYPQYEVKAHVFIVNDAYPRKMSFNSYNLTYGKHDKTQEISCFIANKLYRGKRVGFLIRKGIEAEHKKLTKSGYVRQMV